MIGTSAGVRAASKKREEEPSGACHQCSMPRYGKERHLLVEAPLLEGLGQGAGVNELLREIHVKVADARQVHALAVPQVAAAEVAV